AVADAAAAHRRLASAGFYKQPFGPMPPPPETTRAPRIAAFPLARLGAGPMPGRRVPIFTHRTRGLGSHARLLSHPNGAVALTDVIIAVGDLDDATRRFARFTDRKAIPSPFGVTIELDRGRVQLVSAEAFARKLPDVPIPSLPFVGAYGIRVASVAVTGDLLARNGLRTRRGDHGLIAAFPEELGRGAWLFAE